MFLVILYGCLKSLVALVDMKVLVNANAFGVFLNALAVQINQTNADILYQARQYNEGALRMYNRQMIMELLNLQSLVDHFNDGRIYYIIRKLNKWKTGMLKNARKLQ